jgi:hypothetical protein
VRCQASFKEILGNLYDMIEYDYVRQEHNVRVVLPEPVSPNRTVTSFSRISRTKVSFPRMILIKFMIAHSISVAHTGMDGQLESLLLKVGVVICSALMSIRICLLHFLIRLVPIY